MRSSQWLITIDCLVILVFKPTSIKLFFAILVAITGVQITALAESKNYIGKQITADNQKSTNHRFRKIAKVIGSSDSKLNLTSTNNLLLTKKSGGRSGGGSFKSRPSRSSSPKRSSPSRSSKKRKSTSPSSSKYNQRKSTSPSYSNTRPTYRESTSSPVYRPTTRYNSGRFTLGNVIFFFVFLLFVGGLIFVLFSLVIPMFAANNPKNRAESKIIKERDNDRVTVSLLQIALSSAAENIQQDLSELSLAVDTDSDNGLVELMEEAVLTLLRNQHAWTHVLSSSNSGDINQAEEAFNKLSVTQRSKFSRETLSNVDGQVKTRQAIDSHSDDFPAYVVVTLILGTADDQPLFTKINTEDKLKEVLLELSAMGEDYLIKFELLWTPQTAKEYLTDEELLLEYTDMVSLV